MCKRLGLLLAGTLAASSPGAQTQPRPAFFPIGSYELPEGDDDLRTMRAAGFNLFVCHSKAQLDRAAAAGAKGWVPLPMQLGRDPKLRARVEDVMDHPALAVWEAPDELAWNLAQNEELIRGPIYARPIPEWWWTNPGAMDEAYRKAEPVIDRFREGAAFVRELDRKRHPIWINEAAGSDMKLIRRYLSSVDIIGCDDYPIHGNYRTPARVADSAERYRAIGRGRPLWMVLQGFAWRRIMPDRKEGIAYPSFRETRHMAYSSITHGAGGLLYWGMNVVLAGRPSGPIPQDFRQSLFAMAGELSALEPFLLAEPRSGVHVNLIEAEGRRRPEDRGVSITARTSGGQWAIILVNEDNKPHFGVEVLGLPGLSGGRLDLLYGTESVDVSDGGFVTRLLPQEVKVFASSRRWECGNRTDRNYLGVVNEDPASTPAPER